MSTLIEPWEELDEEWDDWFEPHELGVAGATPIVSEEPAAKRQKTEDVQQQAYVWTSYVVDATQVSVISTPGSQHSDVDAEVDPGLVVSDPAKVADNKDEKPHEQMEQLILESHVPEVAIDAPDVRRDNQNRLRSKSQFKEIFGTNLFKSKWMRHGQIHGSFQYDDEAALQMVLEFPDAGFDPFLPRSLATLCYDTIPHLTADQTGRALSHYLREILPPMVYDALSQLHTFAVLGHGCDAAVLLKVSSWKLCQLRAVGHWAKVHGLMFKLEVSTTCPRGMFLSIGCVSQI